MESFINAEIRTLNQLRELNKMGEKINHEWENSSRSGSDMPKSGGVKSYEGNRRNFIGLEAKLQRTQISILSDDKSIDKSATNKKRREEAIRLKLNPVIRYKGAEQYRVCTLSDGLIQIAYSAVMPKRLTPFSDEESIDTKTAAVYLNVDRDKINKLKKEGLLTGKSGYTTISSLNNYKANMG